MGWLEWVGGWVGGWVERLTAVADKEATDLPPIDHGVLVLLGGVDDAFQLRGGETPISNDRVHACLWKKWVEMVREENLCLAN